MEVKLAESDEAILSCREVMLALRPHIPAERFLPLVKEMIREGYQLAYLEVDGKAAAAVGFRYQQFLHCGKHYYIDDLSTLPEYRGRGYGGQLLEFVAGMARERGFEVITLDSGFHRQDAHRLYLNMGFNVASLHFSKKIAP